MGIVFVYLVYMYTLLFFNIFQHHAETARAYAYVYTLTTVDTQYW